MRKFGRHLGAQLQGGAVIELVGDVGAGKTTLVKAIAEGLGIDEDVQSPSFTISRVYTTKAGLTLAHYDFYRLTDGGIMRHELDEATRDPETITIIEWADVVADVLPQERLHIQLIATGEDTRDLIATAYGDLYQQLLVAL